MKSEEPVFDMPVITLSGNVVEIPGGKFQKNVVIESTGEVGNYISGELNGIVVAIVATHIVDINLNQSQPQVARK